ncbi:hypothetical protein NPIL_336401, partial [Nephila pilipes]
KYVHSPPPSLSNQPKQPIEQVFSACHQPIARQPTYFYLARYPPDSILLELPIIHQNSRSDYSYRKHELL